MQKCPSCGEYEGVLIHHGHDPDDDCPDDASCHSVCRNCDYGLCQECVA